MLKHTKRFFDIRSSVKHCFNLNYYLVDFHQGHIRVKTERLINSKKGQTWERHQSIQNSIIVVLFTCDLCSCVQCRFPPFYHFTNALVIQLRKEQLWFFLQNCRNIIVRLSVRLVAGFLPHTTCLLIVSNYI